MNSLVRTKSKYFSRVAESELKSYIRHFRKNAFKCAKLSFLEDPEKKYDSLEPWYWNVAELDSVHNFPEDYLTFTEAVKKRASVMELVEFLNQAYLGSVSTQFTQLEDSEEKRYLYESYENLMDTELDKKELINSYQMLRNIEVHL